MKIEILSLAIITIVFMMFTNLMACSVFTLQDKTNKLIQANNFDWYIDAGQFHIYSRGVIKSSFAVFPEKQMTWTSKYGSVGLNFIGREFTHVGMNEAGLVIKYLELATTSYPPVDHRYGLDPQQWIQYHLDMSSNVEDVLKSDEQIRPSSIIISPPVHYFITDARGNSVIIEFIDGKKIVYRGKDMPCQALANDSYQNEVKLYNQLDQSAKAQSNDPVLIMNQAIIDYDSGQNIIDYCFATLSKVFGKNTKNSMVFDITDRKIYFKTPNQNHPQVINFQDIDFSQTSKLLFIDMHDQYNGYSEFKTFTQEDNNSLLKAHESLGYFNHIPYIDEWVNYPFEVDKISQRRYQLSAAKTMVDLLKNTRYKTAKKEISLILKNKTDYYFSEEEFIIHASLLFVYGTEKQKELLKMMEIMVALYPKSDKVAYLYAQALMFSDYKIKAYKWLKNTLKLNQEHYEAQWYLYFAENAVKPYKSELKSLDQLLGQYGNISILKGDKSGQLIFRDSKGLEFKMIQVDKLIFILPTDTNHSIITFFKENEKITKLSYKNKNGFKNEYSKAGEKWVQEYQAGLSNPFTVSKELLESCVGEFGQRVFFLKDGQLYYHREGQADMMMIAISEDVFIFRESSSLRIKFIRDDLQVIAVEALYDDLTIKKDLRTK